MISEEELRIYIGRKIKELRKKRSITQGELGKRLGVKNNTISAYERGAISTDQNVLFRLSEIFDVSINEFFPNEDEEHTSHFYNYLPTVISAGLPIDVEAISKADRIQIPDEIMGDYAGNKKIFITKVSGDSMDKVIDDGSLIAVKPISIENLKNGDIVVFSDEYEYSVKRYYRYHDVLVFRPDSYNSVHVEQVYSTKDNIIIHGRVVMHITLH